MAHLIDTSTGAPAIAYVGEKPWHNLGHELTPDAPLDVWTREARLEYTVEAAPVTFQPADADQQTFTGRRVLYRSDNRAPLGIVSDGYRAVQPRTVVEFFAELVKHNGFQMETAGALDGGKRVWALARVNDGAPVIGHDTVRPYLLLATSYDGTLATTAKFTAIRVVCHNTLSMSAGYYDAATGRQRVGEADKTDGAVVQSVRVPHSTDFDPKEARMKLGIVLDAYDRFMVEARMLADTRVDDAFVTAYLKALLPKVVPRNPTNPDAPVEDGRTFKRLMAIWKGEIQSATLPEAKGTAWGLLNAITWDVDHLRGGDERRLASAWFGVGEGTKNKARDMLVAAVS